MNYDFANLQLSKEHANNGVISILGRKDKTERQGRRCARQKIIEKGKEMYVCKSRRSIMLPTQPTPNHATNQPSKLEETVQHKNKNKREKRN